MTAQIRGTVAVMISCPVPWRPSQECTPSFLVSTFWLFVCPLFSTVARADVWSPGKLDGRVILLSISHTLETSALLFFSDCSVLTVKKGFGSNMCWGSGLISLAWIASILVIFPFSELLKFLNSSSNKFSQSSKSFHKTSKG